MHYVSHGVSVGALCFAWLHRLSQRYIVSISVCFTWVRYMLVGSLFYMGACFTGVCCFIWVPYSSRVHYVSHGCIRFTCMNCFFMGTLFQWVHHFSHGCIMFHLPRELFCMGTLGFNWCIIFHMAALCTIWVHVPLGCNIFHMGT